MTEKPDLTKTVSALTDELRRLPGSEKAASLLLDFTTLMERRTRYITFRAGFIMSWFCLCGLLGGNLASGDGLDIPGIKVIIGIVLLTIAIIVVLVLDYRLQNLPLNNE